MSFTTYFSLAELTFSEQAIRLGIDNAPGQEQIDNLFRLCTETLEPARIALGRAMIISSGYRSKKVNELVGGSDTSAHMDGRAVDLRVVGMEPRVFTRWFIRYCEDNNLPVDQVIDEFGRWTHIGIAKAGEKPRRQYLVAAKVNGRVAYTPLHLT